MDVFPIGLLLAQVATPAGIPKKPLYTQDGEKVVCGQIWEAGSRIPIRICRTEAQWDEMARQNQADWANSRNSRSIGCNSLNCI